MNENLQAAIEKLINKTLEGVDASTAFLQAELPDYVYQLLLWYGVYSFIIFACAVVLIPLAWWLPYHFRGQLKAGGMDWTCGPGWQTLWCGSGTITAVFFTKGNLDWLQIWIAPKVWLVEYASGLVK